MLVTRKTQSATHPTTSPIVTATVNNSEVELARVATLTEGNPLAVTYYPQRLGSDDAQGLIDALQPAAVQGYYQIDNFIINLQSDLSSSPNDTGTVSVTGIANIQPSVIPVIGDNFTTILDGRLALFKVMTAEPLTYLTLRMFQVTFVLASWMTANEEVELKRKVLKRFIFEEKRLLTGIAGFIPEDDYASLVTLKKEYRSLLERYNAEFFSVIDSTYMFPTDIGMLFDPGVVNLMREVTGTTNYAETMNVEQYFNYRELGVKDPTFIPNVLRGTDTPVLRKAIIVKRQQLHSTPHYGAGFFYSGITYFRIVVPDDTILVDMSSMILPELSTVTTDTPPAFLTPYDTYFFSNGYYDNSPASKIETVFSSFMRGSSIRPSELLQLSAALKIASPWERFYNTPLILLLMREASQEEFNHAI